MFDIDTDVYKVIGVLVLAIVFGLLLCKLLGYQKKRIIEGVTNNTSDDGGIVIKKLPDVNIQILAKDSESDLPKSLEDLYNKTMYEILYRIYTDTDGPGNLETAKSRWGAETIKNIKEINELERFLQVIASIYAEKKSLTGIAKSGFIDQAKKTVADLAIF